MKDESIYSSLTISLSSMYGKAFGWKKIRPNGYGEGVAVMGSECGSEYDVVLELCVLLSKVAGFPWNDLVSDDKDGHAK